MRDGRRGLTVFQLQQQPYGRQRYAPVSSRADPVGTQYTALGPDAHRVGMDTQQVSDILHPQQILVEGLDTAKRLRRLRI